MDNAPWFDHPDQFDQRASAWPTSTAPAPPTSSTSAATACASTSTSRATAGASAQPAQFPRVDDLSSVMPVDLLGNGTACLVWSSPLPGDARRPMRYVDLMGGQKPHLLVKTVNNLGAETRVHYAPSTKFYLQDKRDGKPWITRLPFPGARGRARRDLRPHQPQPLRHPLRLPPRLLRRRSSASSAASAWSSSGTPRSSRRSPQRRRSPPATNIDAASHVPPVLTKTWFHTGRLSRPRPRLRLLRRPARRQRRRRVLPRAGPDRRRPRAQRCRCSTTRAARRPDVDEEREACRALKGSMLRQEVYARRTARRQIQRRTPYTVTEQNFTIRCCSRAAATATPCSSPMPREAISYHYERNPADPRISHALTLEVDDFGNVLKIGRHRLRAAQQPDPASAPWAGGSRPSKPDRSSPTPKTASPTPRRSTPPTTTARRCPARRTTYE